jgi:hypothetical protein
MLRSLCLVIGLGLLAIGPALPDVINVTVNGTASGSGYGEDECEGPDYIGPLPPGCVEEPGPFYVQGLPFNFSGTNTQLGGIGPSGSATGYNGASISAYASQDTTATASAIDIAFSGGFLGNFLIYAAVSQQDNIAVSFDLTTESEIQLTGNIFQGTGSNSGELLDSMGNVILEIPVTGGSESMILGPGSYQLDASVSGSLQLPYPNSNDQDLYSDLDATFTPVPEPRWAILAALLCLVLGRYRRAVVACEQ